MTTPLLVLDRISKCYPGQRRHQEIHALSEISFALANKEVLTLAGTSGCGKSTILSIVAGLTQPSSGQLSLDGKAITGPGPDRGFIFQHDTLFPWLSVEDNIQFAFNLAANRLSREDRGAARDHCNTLIRHVGLENFRKALPAQLSGGMRQRTAILRALALRPRLMLMDEPFGALDAQTRETMQSLLLDLHESEAMTILFVTHDVEEAVLLSDRILVMHAHPGRVVSTVPVGLPRPRSLDMRLTQEFAHIRGKVLQELRYSRETTKRGETSYDDAE